MRNCCPHKWLCFHAVALWLALMATGCEQKSPQPTMSVFAGPTMGTFFTVKVVDPPQTVDLETLQRAIEEQLDTVDSLMSTYREDSELSRLNRFDRAEWFPVSKETATVIALALEVGQLSGGALDVTVGPLVDLWHFGPKKGQGVPDDEQISAALEKIGQDEIQVRQKPPAVLKKKAHIRIDLSAVAKGYAVDLVARCLEEKGVKNFLVDVGGEVKAAGVNQSGVPWRLAVEAPTAEGRAVQTTVPLCDVAMATSGDYRNFFEQDGTRYSHIIDPRSGRPAAHRLASVSVIDASCARADALATALLVLGPEEGFRLAEVHDLPVLFIIREGSGSEDGRFRQQATPKFEAIGK
jgi:thiamine biosynthesis lipoprotein